MFYPITTFSIVSRPIRRKLFNEIKGALVHHRVVGNEKLKSMIIGSSVYKKR